MLDSNSLFLFSWDLLIYYLWILTRSIGLIIYKYSLIFIDIYAMKLFSIYESLFGYIKDVRS